MLNNLINKFSGNNLTLNQLVEHLDLANLKENGEGNIHFKVYDRHNYAIYGGALNDCELDGLLKQYGKAKIYDLSLIFSNLSKETYVSIELR